MSSGFISEAEIAEARKKRQDEWDKVRKADDPVEPPEEVYDSRSLYERLQEQKQRKELEFEEAHKLKNMIKGLDDDEIDYLEFVDRTKIAADKKRNLEDEKELNDYRNRVASLHEKTYDKKLEVGKSVTSKPKNNFTSKVSSQTKLLKGMVVTKNESTKRKLSDATDDAGNLSPNNKTPKVEVVTDKHSPQNGAPETSITTNNVNNKSGLVCVGILPGLGCYDESSSDECSSCNSDQECTVRQPALDLLGRKIIRKEKES